MIISERTDKEKELFEKILNDSRNAVKSDSESNPNYYLDRTPLQFEEDVYGSICEAAKGTDFDKSIYLISGHKFPDIVAKQYYGVEVKTTKRDQWRSTGNSILETTRVENVKRIYLFFGKLSDPLGFKWRPYEDCLYDVAVTHSPRYLVDMDLEAGKSIFDKINITYDDLCSKNNPIKPIVNYYRKVAKNGEEPWWMGSGDEEGAIVKPTVTLWNNMNKDDQTLYRNQAMARFPEIFSRSSAKYQRLAGWLAARHGIVDSSLRDRFTAGGQVTITINGKDYAGLPRIFSHLNENVDEVIKIVKDLPLDDAKYHWELDSEPAYPQKVDLWAKSIMTHAKQILGDSKEFIAHLLGITFGEEESPPCVKDEMTRCDLDY